MNLNQNVGTADRIIRLLLAAFLGWLYFSGTVTGALGILLVALAVVFVLTSLFAFCPLYAPFKFSTRGK